MSNLANLIAVAKNRASMMVVDPDVAAAKVQKESERAVAKAQKEAERAASESSSDKARKAEERAAKKAAKETQEDKVPHMAKLEKVKESLPELNIEEGVVAWIAANLDQVGLSKIIAHLEWKYKVLSTQASNGVKYEAGQTVKIIAGIPELLGEVAVVVESKRIHAKVIVASTGKEVSCYLSDLEPVEIEVQEEVVEEIQESETQEVAEEVSEG